MASASTPAKKSIEATYDDNIVEIVEKIIKMEKKYGKDVVDKIVRDLIQPHVYNFEYLPNYASGGGGLREWRKMVRNNKKNNNNKKNKKKNN
jgi:hypothetical protein